MPIMWGQFSRYISVYLLNCRIIGLAPNLVGGRDTGGPHGRKTGGQVPLAPGSDAYDNFQTSFSVQSQNSTHPRPAHNRGSVNMMPELLYSCTRTKFGTSCTSLDCLVICTVHGDLTVTHPDSSMGYSFMAAGVNMEEESGIGHCSSHFISITRST